MGEEGDVWYATDDPWIGMENEEMRYLSKSKLVRVDDEGKEKIQYNLGPRARAAPRSSKIQE